MFSRRTGFDLVRLVRKSVNSHHRWVFPASIIAFILMISAGGALARRDITATAVTTVSAASFESVPVAPDAIVAAFGVQLATQTVLGADADPGTPGIQLPTELAGTTVEVNGRRAGLFFVSSGQVNYLIPAATELGTANVVIKAGDGTTSNGTVQVSQVTPAIFTANTNGKGVPAAAILRVKTTGEQIYEPVAEYNQSVSRYITKPINLGPEGEKVFLTLFLTGIRKADDPNSDGNLNENVRVLIGGNEIVPAYAGRQPDLVGLDQINVEIPRSLIGLGVVNVSVSATGFTASNLADIEIAGAGGASPPQVSSFGAASALAGQTLLINGSGFSAAPAENTVRIAGQDCEVMSASTSQLTVMVPFGVETGTVSVRTAMGEGVSTSVLPVRTSISGLVENTQRQAMAGVTVKISDLSISAVTNSDGAFVLADVPPGPQFVEVDGGSIPTDPPYPKITLKVTAYSNRDNQFSRPIAMQQATGSGGSIGGGGSTMAGGGDTTSSAMAAVAAPEQDEPIVIQTGDFKLELPSTTTALFPSGATSGTIFLTPLENGRTPVELPYGYFSTSVVQITPFNVKLDPGAKLTFPNKDGFPAGSPAVLFRYDPTLGQFVREAAAAVSADGLSIETAPGAIKLTSLYFASVLQRTSTITGRVLENNGRTPVAKALARFRGQEALTDGNGSYVLRYVPVKNGEPVSVEISLLRASGRVDRVQSASVPAVLGGITKVPDVILPPDKENRPPVILIPAKIEIEEGKTTDIRLSISDPDPNQTFTVKVEGARFATIARNILTTASTAYVLRLAPGFGESGEYRLILTATDSAGASARAEIVVFVKNVNRAPTAKDQAVSLDEDGTIDIKLEATDPDGNRLGYSIVTRPARGVLTFENGVYRYKPELNFFGTDGFTFRASDGVLVSNTATVRITVRPVNDPPILTVPGAQTVDEGKALNFAITAFDPDSTNLTLSSVNILPFGVTIAPTPPLSWQFSWTPNFTQSGVYVLTLKLTDDGNPQLSDTKEIQITVVEIRGLTVPGGQKINEGEKLSFNVSAIDPGNNQTVNITATGLPPGAELGAQTVEGRQFNWSPDFVQAGDYLVTFRAASDGPVVINESQNVLISVLDVRRDLAKETAPFAVFGAAGTNPQASGDDGDQLGSSIVAGDLNGDRIEDIAVGAPHANGVGLDHGRVYVFFGKRDLEGEIDLAKQSADVAITGEAAEDNFGSSLAIADIDGDGKNDLIIGAPLANVGDFPDAGKVYGIPGGLAAGTYDVEKIASLRLNGSHRSERFGTSLAAGLFHNVRTTAADLIVGAPGYDAPGVLAPLTDAGGVFGFFGGPALIKAAGAAIQIANFAAVGAGANDQIGITLASGNFNLDGLSDFAIGAPLANARAKSNGAVYLVLGSADLAGAKAVSQIAAITKAGADDADAFGAAVAMGDVNGDGADEVVIGAPAGDGPNNDRPNAGEVIVVFGGNDLRQLPADFIIYGLGAVRDEAPDAIGASLAIADFSGDGIGDLAVGSPGADAVDSSRTPTGAVYLLFGSKSRIAATLDLSEKTAEMTIYGADPGDGLGSGALAFGDINATRINDLILGIPFSRSLGNSREVAGEIHALWGVKR